MNELVAGLIGEPVAFEILKSKPGRRQTLRASGPRGRVIVKAYATPRAGTVAARLSALAGGPAEPVIPEVLGVDPDGRFVILSEVRGGTLGDRLLAGDADAPVRVGAALGRWHRSWALRLPPVLRPHTAEREREILEARLAGLPAGLARRIRRAAAIPARWDPVGVVHRDLYEGQILVADRIGLIDLDDAALGPPELDLGNLLAHLELLEIRSGRQLSEQRHALLRSYLADGPAIDVALLEDCRRLSLLRLAAIHRLEPLLERCS